MRKGVLESEFTEEIVRISDDRSHSGRDVGEKVTILEDELMGFVKSVNVLRCRGSNSNWRINQDGLMLKSKSVYKSVTEERGDLVTRYVRPTFRGGKLNGAHRFCN
ncbi:uncharacterized protein LOC103848811 isoform X5 [Brassica rapa]|uniref:uncharacterized protein LOC103848811 isoform X5 n=1 Tax=Brassica campestris TaxID=3711 RepID=UPI00142DEBEE|nr:uncharacterized protein LOC103848811 isoform X5 [Brassica rapa]XP_048615429.1 uncharacterized protein LOC106411221 isoform X4 [Brassica napus]